MGNTKQQLNIAMLGHKRIPSREGGVEIVVEELCTRMVQLGHRVTCYNRRGRHIAGQAFDAAPMREYRGVRLRSVCTIDVKGLAAMTSSLFASIRAALGRYDVVHYHAEGPCAMLWLPKLFGKRCVATIHGLDHDRAKWGRFAKRYLLLGAKCAAKYADALIVLNPGDQRYFRETFHREAVLIPNGVSRPEHLEPDLIRKQFGLRGNDYILFLGRLVPEKGLRTLIAGFRKVRTDKRLVIAGGGSDTDGFVAELKQLAAGDDRILFTGFVQGPLLSELYGNAFIYTLPSLLEGMPLSLMEAMSYGNCCLTSDIPECADLLAGHGMTFHAGDADDLARSLQRLIDDPALVERCRTGAADSICEKYNWDDVVARTLALYRGETDGSK
ncbi:MAG: glycosyltransferase family 4 protein [Aristaeellaceae bacterium]